MMAWALASCGQERIFGVGWKAANRLPSGVLHGPDFDRSSAVSAAIAQRFHLNRQTATTPRTPVLPHEHRGSAFWAATYQDVEGI